MLEQALAENSTMVIKGHQPYLLRCVNGIMPLNPLWDKSAAGVNGHNSGEVSRAVLIYTRRKFGSVPPQRQSKIGFLLLCGFLMVKCLDFEHRHISTI